MVSFLITVEALATRFVMGFARDFYIIEYTSVNVKSCNSMKDCSSLL